MSAEPLPFTTTVAVTGLADPLTAVRNFTRKVFKVPAVEIIRCEVAAVAAEQAASFRYSVSPDPKVPVQNARISPAEDSFVGMSECVSCQGY